MIQSFCWDKENYSADAPDSKPRPANITTNHRFENIHDDDVRFTSLRPKGLFIINLFYHTETVRPYH